MSLFRDIEENCGKRGELEGERSEGRSNIGVRVKTIYSVPLTMTEERLRDEGGRAEGVGVNLFCLNGIEIISWNVR